jgi:hypothetical protein
MSVGLKGYVLYLFCFVLGGILGSSADEQQFPVLLNKPVHGTIPWNDLLKDTICAL